MSNLVAIAYDDVDTAQRVMGTIGDLVKEHNLTLEDAVVVEHKEGGKVKLHQPSMAGVGAASGALWGGLIGLLFFAPWWAWRSAPRPAGPAERWPTTGSTTTS